MKIVFVIDQMRTGGAERVAANLSNEFAAIGHDVCIIMLNEFEPRSHYSVTGKVKLIPVKDKYKKNNPIVKVFLLRKRLIEQNPDVIISFLHHICVYTCFAAFRLKALFIISERNDPVMLPKSRLLRLLRIFVYKRADGCVFQTTGAKEFFSSDIQRKSIIIPNPVVIMHEPAAPYKREKKITAAGRLVPQKNYTMLIRAFALFSAKVKGYKLFICGEGGERHAIEKLIGDLQLNDSVVLLGQVSNPHEILCNSAVFALSSDFEGMPNALLEAMALGVPSVATDCPCGGSAELITHAENGLLVPVGDEHAMADAFERITCHQEFSDKLSGNARKLRLSYSAKGIAEKWLSYIDEVTGRVFEN